MFGVRGRSWIALGSPVGRRDEQLDLLWRFREMADAHAARPAVFGFGPDALPDMVELGFAVQKTGESAILPLADFSLTGRKRETLRRNWRKASEGGATFEVLPAGGAATVMDDLKRISDAWLAAHAGGEKGFSMGGFSAAYLLEFPIALVRSADAAGQGEIVAFASLWPTARRAVFSMDLMRYGADAPKNIMDFLFVELLEWGKAQDYQAFEFGMAPLAGLDDRPLAPVLSRLGKLMFERGEDIYNFQGVRRYKDKYDPIWRPRYIGAPSRWGIPFLLADVGLLSSGGMRGLAKRPKKEPAPSAPPSSAPAAAGGEAAEVHQMHDQHQ
jgi:phosphatidylglycerol lysyltransferase